MDIVMRSMVFLSCITSIYALGLCFNDYVSIRKRNIEINKDIDRLEDMVKEKHIQIDGIKQQLEKRRLELKQMVDNGSRELNSVRHKLNKLVSTTHISIIRTPHQTLVQTIKFKKY